MSKNQVQVKSNVDLKQQDLEKMLQSTEYIVSKSYLPDLSRMSILPTFNIEDINLSAEVRLFKLERLVQNNGRVKLEVRHKPPN